MFNVGDNQYFLKLCSEGSVEQVSMYLLKNTVNVNAVEPVDGNTGLMLATRENMEDMVKFLVTNTATDVNIGNKFGYTALMMAASNGNFNIMETLLSHPDIDLDKANKAGKRAEDCGRKRQNDNVRAVIFQARKRKMDSAPKEQHPPLKRIHIDQYQIKSEEIVMGVPGPGGENIEITNEGEEQEQGEISGDSSDELKTILSARLENCLIEMGSVKENIKLCGEMFKMASKMELRDLEIICRKTLLDNLSNTTVFDILEYLHEDKESRKICLNYLVYFIDDQKSNMNKDWKVQLRKYPDIALELLDHL